MGLRLSKGGSLIFEDKGGGVKKIQTILRTNLLDVLLRDPWNSTVLGHRMMFYNAQKIEQKEKFKATL